MQHAFSLWCKTLFQALCQELPSSKQWAKAFISILACITLGYAAFYAVYQLPAKPLQENIHKAYTDKHFTQNYPPVTILIRPLRVDMYTECFGIGTALQPYKSIDDLFLNKTYGECAGLSQAAEKNFSEPPAGMYSRYIHGYSIFTRLFYTFFDMQTARTVCSIISCFLLLCLGIALKIRVSTAHATLVIGSFLLVNSPSMYVLLSHAAQFWLVLMAAIAATLVRSKQAFFTLMACVGALDGFFTFLSMGSLSLSIPLLCFLLVGWATNTEETLETSSSLLAQGFWACVAWAMGFLLPWLCKWGILYFIYDLGKAEIFGSTVEMYAASGIGMILLALWKNFFITHMEVWAPLFALLFWIRRKEERTMPRGLWITLFAALIPLVWVCLLPGQSGIKHSFFVNIIVWPILCFACFYLFTPEKQASFKDLLPLNLRKL